MVWGRFNDFFISELAMELTPDLAFNKSLFGARSDPLATYAKMSPASFLEILILRLGLIPQSPTTSPPFSLERVAFNF